MALLSVACATFMPISGSSSGPWRICRSHRPYSACQLRRAACLKLMDEGGPDDGSLAMPRNRYVDEILNITAPDLIKGFAETAPAEVQQAVRATVVSLLGNLPPHMYDVSVASTGKNVASLMYSMQMTGYMFRSAEYRRSLMESLSMGEGTGLLPPVDDGGDDESRELPQVSGTITVKLSEDTEAEVEASAYMAELRNEVAQLRGELMSAKKTSSEAQGGGLLAYVQSIGRDKIGDLTASISDVRSATRLPPRPLTRTQRLPPCHPPSQEVLESMRLLIENILSEAGVGGEQFMEVTGLKLRELLVWQLITGYKLRELEAKEELNKLLDD